MPTNREGIFTRESSPCGFQEPFLRPRLKNINLALMAAFRVTQSSRKSSALKSKTIIVMKLSGFHFLLLIWNLPSRFGYRGLHTEFSCVHLQISFKIKGKWSRTLKLTWFTVLQDWHIQRTVDGEFQTCQHTAHTAETAVLVVYGSHRNKAEIINFHHWWETVVTWRLDNDTYQKNPFWGSCFEPRLCSALASAKVCRLPDKHWVRNCSEVLND